jgi:hypothetical protein
VRLALSKDDLNTKEIERRSAISLRAAATSLANASDSSTQGPAISNKGCPAPTFMGSLLPGLSIETIFTII